MRGAPRVVWSILPPARSESESVSERLRSVTAYVPCFMLYLSMKPGEQVLLLAASRVHYVAGDRGAGTISRVMGLQLASIQA